MDIFEDDWIHKIASFSFNQSIQSKNMCSKGLVNKNHAYFQIRGSNWFKLGIFVDKRHILDVIDLIFG